MHHIPIGIQYETNTGEDEAGQPREDSASYLDRTSITNEHKKRQSSEERISHHISIRIQIRNEHRRRQGIKDKISDHISIGMEQETNTGEYEAG